MHCDDGTIDLCPAFKPWNESIRSAASKAGTRLDAILGVHDLLKERGFVKVQHAHIKWALGSWPKGTRDKKIGELFRQDILSALEGLSMRQFATMLGWSREALVKNVEEARAEIRSGRMHVYMPM